MKHYELTLKINKTRKVKLINRKKYLEFLMYHFLELLERLLRLERLMD